MQALICVDETGNFWTDKVNRVGGFCTELTVDELEARLKTVHGAFVAEEKPRRKLPFPACLHMAPLISPAVPGNERLSRGDLETGKKLVDRVLGAFAADLECFHSSGRTPIFIHEQQHYLDHLLVALCGLLRGRSWDGCELIDIHIASRRCRELLGFRDVTDWPDFEARLAVSLRDKFAEAAGVSSGIIRVSIGRYTEPGHLGLALADFVLGNAGHPEKCGLRFLRPFRVSDFYVIVAGAEVSRFKADLRQDAPEAIFRFFRYASRLPAGARRDDHLGLIAKNAGTALATPAAVDRFLFLLEEWLEELRRLRPQEPEEWALMPVISDALADLAGTLEPASRLARRLTLTRLRLRVDLAAHGLRPLDAAGREELQAGVEALFRDEGGDLFPDVLKRLRELAEIRLMLVQDVFFNQLAFEGVRDCLEPLDRLWTAIRSALGDSGLSAAGPLDDVQARIKGTLGQALAFLGCHPDCDPALRTRHFAEADSLFKESQALLDPGTLFYSQGNNYRVTLAWVAGDLPRALALHFRDGRAGFPTSTISAASPSGWSRTERPATGSSASIRSACWSWACIRPRPDCVPIRVASGFSLRTWRPVSKKTTTRMPSIPAISS